MSGTDASLWLLGIASIFFGWRVFATQSMVRASFLLLLSFIATALMLLLLAAPYIAMATIFMMAVEMMVMALFMVMFMMNPAGLNPMMMVHQQRFSIGAGVAVFAGIAVVTSMTDFPINPVTANQAAIADLGKEMLGGSMLIFESAGVTLLATMVGAVILSSRSGRFGSADTGSMPPALEPGGAPAGRVPDPNRNAHSKHAMKHGEDEPTEQSDAKPEHGHHGGHDT